MVGNEYKVETNRYYFDIMERIKTSKGKLIAIPIFIIIALVVGVLYWQLQPRFLYPQEILEYEGQDLSSISNFRENSIKGPQEINETTYRLTITGLVNKTLEFTYNDVINGFPKYKKVVTLHCVEGWSVKILWEGFLLKELLSDSGINSQAEVAIFYAYDGYSTSLPLEYIFNKNIIIAYKMNGIVLPQERGFPFQLVAESKYGYKWIKWITEIEISDNEDYRGFWESRGWPNEADLP